jgi:hypothetical protein
LTGSWRVKMAAMTTRIFELRTYQSSPGRLEALSARFRDHTMALFARHGITVEGFWSAEKENDPTTGTLVYVCSYPSREAAAAAWKAFAEDPEWTTVRAQTEADGPLAERVESLYMEPTDYSPMR